MQKATKMNNNKLKIKETFISALQNHQKNNFEIAEGLYKEILKVNPNHFESVFYLGALLVQTKNFDKGTVSYTHLTLPTNREV